MESEAPVMPRGGGAGALFPVKAAKVPDAERRIQEPHPEVSKEAAK
jgi:hypothetical protein